MALALFHRRRVRELTILHSGSWINFKLTRINWAPQAGIVSPRIFSVCITLGIVDVFGRKVATQSFLGDLEFPGGISMSQESQSLMRGLVTSRVLKREH